MMRRRWDFFIEWLLDASPPRVYDLNRQPGATSPNNLQSERSMSVLADLVAALESGAVKVVDLSQPLGPDTPVIGLPAIFASSPGVTLNVISCYDDKGPAWYWNTISMGEHTGTHFDAPVHWISGKDLKDNRCDTIPARRFVGPACVIDVTAEVAKNEDYLLMPEHVTEWENQHGRIPRGAWVLLRTGWSLS